MKIKRIETWFSKTTEIEVASVVEFNNLVDALFDIEHEKVFGLDRTQDKFNKLMDF